MSDIDKIDKLLADIRELGASLTNDMLLGPNKEIEIIQSKAELLSFDKDIVFTYGGKEHEVLLHWHFVEGYDLSWVRPLIAPEWAQDIDTLASHLDQRTTERVIA